MSQEFGYTYYTEMELFLVIAMLTLVRQSEHETAADIVDNIYCISVKRFGITGSMCKNFTYFILQIISAAIRIVLAPDGVIRNLFLLEL